METRVSSAKREVIIGDGRPTVLIGERINASARKGLAAALKAGDWEKVRQEALAQAEAGADILDVNVNVFGVDEAALLPAAVKAISEVVDLPLCLDSANPKALEAALKVYRGKPLINSVTGEERSLESILPLVKEYGAAVTGLTQDDAGIPRDAARRVAIARRIVERAAAAGIPAGDVVIDCLASSLGADSEAGPTVLAAIAAVKAELGVNQTIGASNISFGLPARGAVNSAFLAASIAAGVTCPIVDARQMRQTGLATDLILGRDKRARRYMAAFREGGNDWGMRRTART